MKCKCSERAFLTIDGKIGLCPHAYSDLISDSNLRYLVGKDD